MFITCRFVGSVRLIKPDCIDRRFSLPASYNDTAGFKTFGMNGKRNKVLMKIIQIPEWAWILIGLVAALVILAVVLPVENQTITQEVRDQVKGEFARLSDGAVYYELRGESGPLVVLVHGFSVPSYVWDPTVESLEESGFRVLRYDLYGRGYSDRPDLTYDLDLFVNQLSELLNEINLDQQVHLVGLSMGGPIAAQYANTHPQSAASIVLIAPEAATLETRDIFPMNVPLVGEYFMMVIMEPFILPRMQPGDFYRPELYPEWEARYKEQLKFKGTGRALLSTIRSLVELQPEAIYQKLAESRLPVLIIRGEEDQTISESDMIMLRSFIPESEYVEIPEAGHLPHYEQAALVSEILIDFLERLQ
jgi:pimeloyl-ACP methyl ester carboxylesterase